MNVEIFRDKLLKGLNIIEPLIKRVVSLPILNNILIESHNSFIKIIATNLESSIVWKLLSNVEEDGKICVPLTYLKQLVSNLKDDDLKLISEKGNLIIGGDNFENKIQGVDSGEYPIMPEFIKGDPIKISSDKLIQGLQLTSGIPMFTQIRPEISGVYFKFEKNVLKIVGTDSFRLAEKKIKNDNLEFEFILPQSSSKELLNILGSNEYNVDIYLSEGQVLFECLSDDKQVPSIEYYSKLIDGNYPPYQNIIPENNIIEFEVNKKNLIAEIKKASIFANKSQEITLTVKDELMITSENQSVGKNESFVSINKIKEDKKDKEIKFNYRYLLDGLSLISDEDIVFTISEKKDGQDGPSIMSSKNDDTFLYLVMPTKPD